MYKINKIYSIVASLILAVATGNAHATLVNFTLTGDVDFWADSGNDFGLELDDTITATGTFDDSVLSGSGFGTIDFSSGSGNSLTINVGSMTFFESDDNDFDFGFPEMTIGATQLDFDLSFSTTFGSNGGYFDSLFDTFDASNDSFIAVNGTWDAASLNITPVPVPAALWLFGSGLIGLAGVAKQRKIA